MAGSHRSHARPPRRDALFVGVVLALGLGLSVSPGALGAAAVRDIDAVRVVVGGDNRDNSHGGTRATGDLVRALVPAVVLNVGDFASSNGDFARDYAVYWNSFRSITHAVVGNHEADYTAWKRYFSPAQVGAAPYWRTAFDVGQGWRVIDLDGNSTSIGVPVGPGSATYAYLAAQLAAHPGPVVVAWHQPRYTWTSVNHRDWAAADGLYRLVRSHGRAIIVNGHLHDYQRLAEDGADGVTEFVVGTGGAPLYPVDPHARGARPALEAFDDQDFGVLLLTLRPGGYDWEFHTPGGIRDSGSKTF